MPNKKGEHIRRVGLVFAGGPAPGANAVISAASICFLDDGRDVVGFLNGYQHLQEYHPVTHRLQLDTHYREFRLRDVTGMRNSRPRKVVEVSISDTLRSTRGRKARLSRARRFLGSVVSDSVPPLT